jgi:hypothetical protein
VAEATYAARSWRAFKLMWLLLAIGAVCFEIGLGAAFARRGPDILAPVGILLLVAAAWQNLVAFHTGVAAWRRERVKCYWLYVNVILTGGMIAFGIMLLRL